MSEVTHKQCSKCGEVKPLEAFTKRKDSKDGRRADCRTCISLRTKAHYDADPEKARQRQRDRRAANPGRDAASTRARRAANPEHFRQVQRAWKAANPEKVSASNKRYRERHLDFVKRLQREWWERNHEQASIQQRQYRQANPDILRAKTHRRLTLIRQNGGGFTAPQIQALRIAQNYRCAYCERHIALTIEHIVPAKRGGSSDISNICLACRKCNCSKQDKLLSEWTDRWYYNRKTG